MKIHSKQYINIQDLEIDENLKEELLNDPEFHCLLSYCWDTQEIQIYTRKLEEHLAKHKQIPDLVGLLNQERIDYIVKFL